MDKRINKSDLQDFSRVSFNVLAKIGKSEAVSSESLGKIYRSLHCNIGDVVEFTINWKVDSLKRN